MKIIYFDKFDKISDTHKGIKTTHLLTHLTDPYKIHYLDNYSGSILIYQKHYLFHNDVQRDRIFEDRMYV